MNIEIHPLRYRELLREADHYRLAVEARKTEPAFRATTIGKRRSIRLRLPARRRGSPRKKRRAGSAGKPGSRRRRSRRRPCRPRFSASSAARCPRTGYRAMADVGHGDKHAVQSLGLVHGERARAGRGPVRRPGEWGTGPGRPLTPCQPVWTFNAVRTADSRAPSIQAGLMDVWSPAKCSGPSDAGTSGNSSVCWPGKSTEASP